MSVLASIIALSPLEPSSLGYALLYLVFIKVACSFTSAWAPSEESSRWAIRFCAVTSPRALRMLNIRSARLFMRCCNALALSVVKTTLTLVGSSVIMWSPFREATSGRANSAVAAILALASSSACFISSTWACECSFSMQSVMCILLEGMKMEESMPSKRCKMTSSRNLSTCCRNRASCARGTERKCVYSSFGSSFSHRSSIWAFAL
mmetsp:Transcript_34703/g.75683  ORF Transcript_34703/g.75683 Transcript_34703/m.75683 type:complete len:207 (+) Transcript_34703:167-787(+)